MTIQLDHTIVPAKDKIASARFFADVFGLAVKPGPGYFAQVQVNEGLGFGPADQVLGVAGTLGAELWSWSAQDDPVALGGAGAVS